MLDSDLTVCWNLWKFEIWHCLLQRLYCVILLQPENMSRLNTVSQVIQSYKVIQYSVEKLKLKNIPEPNKRWHFTLTRIVSVSTGVDTTMGANAPNSPPVIGHYFVLDWAGMNTTSSSFCITIRRQLDISRHLKLVPRDNVMQYIYLTLHCCRLGKDPHEAYEISYLWKLLRLARLCCYLYGLEFLRKTRLYTFFDEVWTFQ